MLLVPPLRVDESFAHRLAIEPGAAGWAIATKNTAMLGCSCLPGRW